MPDVHIPSDFAGMTHLNYDPDDREYMRNKLGPWLNVINGNRLPKSKNNLLMAPRRDIHTPGYFAAGCYCEKALDFYPDNTIKNNLAYMIRRGEYVSYKYAIRQLLDQSKAGCFRMRM